MLFKLGQGAPIAGGDYSPFGGIMENGSFLKWAASPPVIGLLFKFGLPESLTRAGIMPVLRGRWRGVVF